MSPDVAHQESDANAPEPDAQDSTSLTERERTKEDLKKIQLDRYVNRDLIHSATLWDAQNARQVHYGNKLSEIDDYKKVKNEYRQWFPPSKLYGQGYNGYGNGVTDANGMRLLYPSQKPKLGDKRGLKKAPRLYTKRKDLIRQAELHEELVPIRIEVEYDKIKLQDTFTWNLADRTVDQELFAKQLVEDFGLQLPAATPILSLVQTQLSDQLNEFYPHVFTEEDALDPELPYSAYKNDELRMLVKLNITIGTVTLVDQFEWDINNHLNSPEEFAQSMARELALSGEFATSIAHSIREQTQLFTKSLYITGYPFDGRPLDDAELISAFLPSPIASVFRPQQQAKDYMPYLYENTEAELEKAEIMYSREQRRQKRSTNRRGGPVLPDLSRQRTVRTRLVHSVIPSCVQSLERPTDNPIYKRIVAKKKGMRDGDLSESSGSEESGEDSPMPSVTQGTARTRGIRGAATAAQQRMANIGRSETPELLTPHNHETRISARRIVRDESEERSTYIVRLKVGKEKLNKWVRAGMRPRPAPSEAPSMSKPTVAPAPVPAPGSMGPPSTPGIQSQKLAAASTPGAPAQIGRIDAPPPPPPGQPSHPVPPAPDWLQNGLKELRAKYPKDRFEGVMRYSAVSKTTDTPIPMPPPGQPLPDDVKFMYAPRVRCNDCPGKLYTPGPEMTVANFEVHLKNRQHRDKVEARTGGRAAAS
ncbi:hypothetical protein BJ878DRAFT_419281 [Calycina marina]|uniref:SNF5-domain-containing protein n=1 Tax=Calycina marina TaxID=1763456 RepID=A0A9P8CFQ3_9HELO|nr:hypothetical protein BJ878DRAFT_419281 [Calycina marina]